MLRGGGYALRISRHLADSSRWKGGQVMHKVIAVSLDGVVCQGVAALRGRDDFLHQAEKGGIQRVVGFWAEKGM